jgi:excisionase family DNA binding protein
MADEEWITTREAAKLIGVTIHHISYLLRKGHIKGQKFGNFWMVERTSAEVYANKERKPGPKSQNS